MNKERIKLKVVSDGTSYGTKVYDQDGKVLENVTDFSFSVATDGLGVVNLSLVGVPVEINYTAQVTSLEELAELELESTAVVKTEEVNTDPVVTVDNI